MSDLDPRLQREVVRAKRGQYPSPDKRLVSVTAEVTDIHAWESLSGVRTDAKIGPLSPEGTYLVTARIPVDKIESVRRQRPLVKGLKAARLLRPQLSRTTEEIEARLNLLPAGNRADGGRGAVVGIVDHPFDFEHDNFRNPDGSTRALMIWDQNETDAKDPRVPFGRLHTRAEINEALTADDPFAALGYIIPRDSLRHGTLVTDIAAGNGLGTEVPGVAPNADIIFVDVSTKDVAFEGLNAIGMSLGNSARLIQAIQFIFEQAGDNPCVVNVSLGTSGGPHDGTTHVERWIDTLIRQKSNRSVTIAAGNFFAAKCHTAGAVAPNGQTDLRWLFNSGDPTGNELEIWYSGRDRFAVEILTPAGESLLRVEPGAPTKILERAGRSVLLAANRLEDTDTRDNLIDLFVEAGLEFDELIIRLHGLAVERGQFHAWIERDDEGQSTFGPASASSYTLGTISCGHESIVVASYNAHNAGLPVSSISSSGPTRDNRDKPEVAAPGEEVIDASSGTTFPQSGTSLAAPAVAGTIALMLSEAKQRGISLSGSEIRDIIIRTARKSPPAGPGFDPRFGNGRVSAAAAVAAVIALASG